MGPIQNLKGIVNGSDKTPIIFHFLMVCPAYNEYRANVFNSITVSHEFNTMTIEEKFIFIMSTPLGGVDILFLLFPPSAIRCHT